MNHIHERPSLLANTEILYILAPYWVCALKRISALENCRSSCDITVYKDRKKATKKSSQRVTTHRSPVYIASMGKTGKLLTHFTTYYLRLFPRNQRMPKIVNHNLCLGAALSDRLLGGSSSAQLYHGMGLNDVGVVCPVAPATQVSGSK